MLGIARVRDFGPAGSSLSSAGSEHRGARFRMLLGPHSSSSERLKQFCMFQMLRAPRAPEHAKPL
eukprot:2142240-Alexandrium_andersonii.AAC.1